MQATQQVGHQVRKNLWMATSSPGTAIETLEGGLTADVVVVGGGVAGLSTALHLAESGSSVVLLEAHSPGSGASGDSGGLLAPDFIRHSPAEVTAALGSEQGDRFINLVGSSATQCMELVARHGIDCDARLDGFWVPAHNATVLDSLNRRASEWQHAGFDVTQVAADEAAANLGSSRYCGAIRFAAGGSINPLAYCRGLASAAVRHGAALFANSPVSQLRRHGENWRVQTPNGYVEAGQVVLAANGGNPALHPAMQRSILPLGVFEYATRPLSAAQRAGILPQGGAMTDKQPYLFTGRYDKDGRLIAAFPDFFIGRTDEQLLAEASRRLVQHFPQLQGIGIEYLWRGKAWLTPSLLPKIYRLDQGLLAIQSCNGRGLATNTVLGREIAAAISNKCEHKLSVKPEKPVAVTAHWFAQYVPSLLMARAYVADRFIR